MASFRVFMVGWPSEPRSALPVALEAAEPVRGLQPMKYFRDINFCSSDCTNTECFRHFGDDDAEAAKQWWGRHDEPPVSYMDFSWYCETYSPPNGSPGGSVDA